MSAAGKKAPAGRKAPPAPAALRRGPASWERFQEEIQDAAVVVVNEYDAMIGRLGVFESEAPLEAAKEAAVLALYELTKRCKLSITEGTNQFGPEAWIRKFIEGVRKEEGLRK